MRARHSDPPQLPIEVILIILDKSKELLDSDVQTYVNHHKGVCVDPGLMRNNGSYLLYHDRFGFDDCVFWHQCWTYTALRLISPWTNRHVSNWANNKHVDGLIRKHEGLYDKKHPDHNGTKSYARLQSHAAEFFEDTMANVWPDSKDREKAIWTVRKDFVPSWDKFMEAHSYMPEGTQTLPWQAGYDKAAAFCCLHVNEHMLHIFRQQTDQSTKLRPNSYFRAWQARLPPGGRMPPHLPMPMGIQVPPPPPPAIPLPPLSIPIPHHVHIPPPIQLGAQLQMPAPMQNQTPAQVPSSADSYEDV